MRLNTINLQIVKNLGNYETLRIGAEWTPDSNESIAEAMAKGMEELNATADMLIGKKSAQAQAAPAEKKPEPKPEPQPSAAPEKKEDEPDALDMLNAGTDGDGRELVTLAQPSKFNKTLGRIMAGVSIEKVCEHFKFDPDTLAIIRAYLEKNRVTLAFGDPAFELLIKAVEAQKDIANICNYIQFADQNTANAWQLALNLCNAKK